MQPNTNRNAFKQINPQTFKMHIKFILFYSHDGVFEACLSRESIRNQSDIWESNDHLDTNLDIIDRWVTYGVSEDDVTAASWKRNFAVVALEPH